MYDVAIIGSGPGGYVAAIRAAQLGMKVACVEREALGGICLNWGCIPTKALLRSAEVLELCRSAGDFGIEIQGEIGFDFKKVMERSRKVAAQQEKGVTFLFKKNKIEHVVGTGRLAGGGKIEVTGKDGAKKALEAKHIVIATGARAKSLPGVDIDGERVIEYRGALSLEKLPRSMAVIGAGAIGVEFASFYRTLGVEITLVEFLPTIVPLEDADVSDALSRSFKKRGIKLKTSTKVTGIDPTDAGVRVHLAHAQDDSKTETLEAELALMAIGVQANVEDLGLEAAGVELERGFVKVEKGSYQTSARGIYAIGDVIGPPALAHVASAEGIACIEGIAGETPEPINYGAIPACTFCSPEIGSVGLTEKQAREKGLDVKVGKFPFTALGKARAAGDTEGFVKVLYGAKDGRVLGAHIIGHHASDLIAEFGLALTTEVNAQSLLHTVHAHPTLAEAAKEATEEAYERAIHL